MNDKGFKIILAIVVVGVIGGGLIFMDSQPEVIRPGEEHEDNGVQHISPQDSPGYNGPEPPTSGDHAQPVDKGVYETELPDVNTIHNLEHGYIYVSYQPDLPQEDIDKLQQLFFSPFSNTEFSPSKVIMAPRAANESPIVLSSWLRSQLFETFDEQMMVDYYLQNVNKSPEPTAS